jgi:hypothetical protein
LQAGQNAQVGVDTGVGPTVASFTNLKAKR